MFDKLINKIKHTIDETEQIDEQFYAQVMDELSKGYKDKALVGKAIAQSNGNETKFNSIYVKLRAKDLQEKYRQKQVPTKYINKELPKSIAKKYIDGEFYKMFENEIKELGYYHPIFCYSYNELKKDGKRYYGKVDYEKMYYLIVDKDNNVMHKFAFTLT